METPKIVTGLVILSIGLAGCRAKFTAVNNQKDEPGTQQAATPTSPSTPVFPTGPVKPQVPNTATPPPITPNICETSDDETVGRDRIVVRRTVTFYRGKQMVWRKNCDGKVVSKKWENLGHNMGKVVRIEHPGARSWNATNRSTCANMGQTKIVKSGSPVQLELPVSLIASSKAMQVREGRNLIDFEVKNRAGELVRGTLILTVRVSDNNGDCIVIKAKNCPPKTEASLTGTLFGY